MRAQQLERLERQIDDLLNAFLTLQEEHRTLQNTNKILHQAYAKERAKNQQARERLTKIIRQIEQQQEVEYA